MPRYERPFQICGQVDPEQANADLRQVTDEYGHSLTESLKVSLRNPDIIDVSFTFTEPSKGMVQITSEKKLPAMDLGWAEEWINTTENLTIAPFLKEQSYFEQESGQTEVFVPDHALLQDPDLALVNSPETKQRLAQIEASIQRGDLLLTEEDLAFASESETLLAH